MLTTDRSKAKTKTEKSGHISYQFIEYERTDFLLRSMKIFVDDKNIITRIEFNSTDHGFVIWDHEKGIVNFNRWETDEEVTGPDHWRHYPIRLLNGPHEMDDVRTVTEDILSNLDNAEFAKKIRSAIDGDKEPIHYT